MKQQQHDIKCKENSEKKPESLMGFEPTALRYLVGCSNTELLEAPGPTICGPRVEPHHAATQPSNDWHTGTR